MNRLIVDTETLGSVDQRETVRVYDVAWQVVNKDFLPLVRRRYLVREVFFGMAEQMQSAYYADKLPQYFEEIAAGTVQVVSMADIHKQFAADCKEYGIMQVWAFNAGFDRDALNITVNDISNGLRSWFAPYGVKWCCIQHVAAQTILNRSSYFRFAHANGFYSKSGNVRTNAEAAYSYLVKDSTFQEAHTALEDVKIETVILQACLKQKGKKDKKINRAAWQVPQKSWQAWLEKHNKTV